MVRRIIRSVQLAVTACAVIGLFIVSGQTPLLAQETAVRRTTLLVEDIGRSIDFYQRLGPLQTNPDDRRAANVRKRTESNQLHRKRLVFRSGRFNALRNLRRES
mgnify:CR=1 FL=1